MLSLSYVWRFFRKLASPRSTLADCQSVLLEQRRITFIYNKFQWLQSINWSTSKATQNYIMFNFKLFSSKSLIGQILFGNWSPSCCMTYNTEHPFNIFMLMTFDPSAELTWSPAECTQPPWQFVQVLVAWRTHGAQQCHSCPRHPVPSQQPPRQAGPGQGRAEHRQRWPGSHQPWPLQQPHLQLQLSWPKQQQKQINQLSTCPQKVILKVFFLIFKCSLLEKV